MSPETKKKNENRHMLPQGHAILLAGGSGTRLWPLSRNLLPKQLLSLNGEDTLLQQTAIRMEHVFSPHKMWVVTNEELAFEVRSQLKKIDPELESQVISEPKGRNTLPAILLGLDGIVRDDPDAIVGVFPADHQIEGEEGWREALFEAARLAEDGWLVTFGIKPLKPETGYGYIAKGKKLALKSFAVAGFVEKPDSRRAAQFVESGDYFWNSGMFMFKASRFLESVKELQPKLWDWWAERTGRDDITKGYTSLPDVSVDYGIVEKTDRIAVVEADFSWDDLGSWEALYRLGNKDESGCVVQGDVLSLGCDNSLLYSWGGKLAAVGLQNMIVVQTRDATLVCPLEKVQKVKDVVQTLKSQESSLAVAHVTVRRPWGSYTVLEDGPHYKIKRITVTPGAKLSLQMHHHRSEHWVVIHGTAEVEVGEQKIILTENQSVDIPKATRHRLSNPGKVLTEIIEIQSGPYLEEDDIVRFDDDYGRIKKGLEET